MLNITGKYITVFQPQVKLEISEKIVFATLSSSKKIFKDGETSYENMMWNGKFVAGAFEKAKSLKDFDKIDIIKGSITNKYDKSNNRVYVEVTIFDFIMSKKVKGGENNDNDL